MKNLIAILAVIVFTMTLNATYAQTYLISTGGTVNTCTGTFYDSGNSGGQYSNNENYTMTFCSGAPGLCISANFTSFNTELGWDFLSIYDGPSTASPLIGTYSGNLGALGSFSSSGTCLTFSFTSDNSNKRAGWVAAITCGSSCPTVTTVAPAASQNRCQGSAANTLTASTTTSSGCGTPTIQYQWYSNTANNNTIASASAISGATSSTYTPPTSSIGTMYYFCVSYATNNGCSQSSTTQSLASNVVQVNTIAPPSTSVAGSNQSICIGSTASLTANTPVNGTGVWSVVSGPSLSSAQFSSISAATATFTPAGGTGNYVLQWTISNAPCSATSSTVGITVNCGGACPACPSTIYTHPTAGIANEKVGSCLVMDCGPATYTDNGGASGNYSNNIGSASPANAPYRVFCPSQAGNCMQVTFNSFNTFNNLDVLYVRNGPTEFSPNFTSAPTATSAWPSPPNAASFDKGLFGDLSSSVPFSFTSTDPSGCLTFAFVSSAANVQAGWSATLSCVPCAGGPNGTDNSDCIRATGLCSNASVAGNSSGPGIISEGCNGTSCPNGGENHTNWYVFQAATSGTLDITVTPTNASDDYDFAVFGPNPNCTSLGLPLRCSDAGSSGTTGTSSAALDFTEDVTGNKFVAQMNVTAGQSFLLMVDEWSTASSSGGYSLSFGGTASLDCTVLPIQLSEFNVQYVPEEKASNIYWRTETERNNDFFTIEKSRDGIHFENLTFVDGAGNSSTPTEYFAFDPNVETGVTYYRLKQTDFDGKFEYSDVFSINALNEVDDILSLFPNPTTSSTDLIFNCYQTEIAYLTVTDAKGFEIIKKEFPCKKGANYHSIDLSNFNSGIYMFTLTTSTKVYSNRLIKE
ncbi:MAG: hypothetical protein RI922_2508 [Bacteroidota bacterium]|jgi:hypothetical protein